MTPQENRIRLDCWTVRCYFNEGRVTTRSITAAGQGRCSLLKGWKGQASLLETPQPVPAEFSDWEGEVAHRSLLIAHRDVPIESWVTCTTVEVELEDLLPGNTARSTDLKNRLQRAARGGRTPPLCLQDFQGHTTEGYIVVAHLGAEQFKKFIDDKPRDSGEGGLTRLPTSAFTSIAEISSPFRHAAVFPDWANPSHDLWISTEVLAESDPLRGEGRHVLFDGDLIAGFHLRISILKALESRAQRIMMKVMRDLVPMPERSLPTRWLLDRWSPTPDPSDRLLASERDLLLGSYLLGRAGCIQNWQYDEPVWEWMQSREGLDDSSAQRSPELQLAQELVATAARRRVVGSAGTSMLAILGLNLLSLISTWATFLQVVERPDFPAGVHHWIGRSSLEVVSVLALGGFALLFPLVYLIAQFRTRTRNARISE
jgi:hypothetical protein